MRVFSKVLEMCVTATADLEFTASDGQSDVVLCTNDLNAVRSLFVITADLTRLIGAS